MYLQPLFLCSLPDTGERVCGTWEMKGNFRWGTVVFRECGILKMNNGTCINFPGWEVDNRFMMLCWEWITWEWNHKFSWKNTNPRQLVEGVRGISLFWQVILKRNAQTGDSIGVSRETSLMLFIQCFTWNMVCVSLSGERHINHQHQARRIYDDHPRWLDAAFTAQAPTYTRLYHLESEGWSR